VHGFGQGGRGDGKGGRERAVLRLQAGAGKWGQNMHKVQKRGGGEVEWCNRDRGTELKNSRCHSSEKNVMEDC